MKQKIYELLDKFMKEVLAEKIEVYNEFSLQHELGIFLRNGLKENCKVQFERNVKNFGITKKTIKYEIDIVIYKKNAKIETKNNKEIITAQEKYAIELKYPRNKQYPEQMYSFIKDIRFMEQLNSYFTNTYCVTLVDDKLFYNFKENGKGIYEYFRKNKTINGKIHKPTGKINKLITINGQYYIKWKNNEIDTEKRYYIIDISQNLNTNNKELK